MVRKEGVLLLVVIGKIEGRRHQAMDGAEDEAMRLPETARNFQAYARSAPTATHRRDLMGEWREARTKTQATSKRRPSKFLVARGIAISRK